MRTLTVMVMIRTTGKVAELCSRSYGECVASLQATKDDPETASVTECVIYRYAG